jgi:hypothetical protein
MLTAATERLHGELQRQVLPDFEELRFLRKTLVKMAQWNIQHPMIEF